MSMINIKLFIVLAFSKHDTRLNLFCKNHESELLQLCMAIIPVNAQGGTLSIYLLHR